MAQITGSSTLDWSDVQIDSADYETQLAEFSNRLGTLLNEDPQVLSVTSTQIIIRFPISGGTGIISGSGFGTSAPVMNSFNYRHPSGDVLNFTGNFDFVGNEVINRLGFGFSGFRATMVGKIVIDQSGNTSSVSITQLKVTLDSTQVTIKGSLVADANFDITGTITQISVLSGTNSMVMSELSLPYGALDSITTTNDLFSFVGNQLSGNDVITYTNNSAVGITLYGGAGNDTITVIGANADTLVGGTDNDTYVHVAGGASDSYIENPDEGTDTIRAVVTLTLPDASQNIENLTLTGSGNIDGTGNTLNNVLTGNSGNNLLSGGDGNDQLKGGAGNDTLDGGTGDDVLMGGTGNDTYTVDVASDVVTEGLTAGTDKVFSASIDYTLTANVENLELTASADINGTGNALANVITGNSGVNILTGDAGNDTYIVQNDADSVVESFNAGIDLVQSSAASFTLGDNVEKLTLTDSADITGTGNALNNRLTGNIGHNTLSGDAGNDTLIGGVGDDNLDGGAGTDNMTGGLGDDTYTVDRATDVVSEALNAGTDTVLASLNYRLAANVENLELTGAAINGTGNALNNILTGNSGNNLLSGLAGNDTLNGGDGNDILIGGLGQDGMGGGLGNDTYRVNRGDGQDTIGENDSTLGNSDNLLYGATINPLNLVLSRQVDDLRIALHGTTEHVTIQNWYANPTTAQVETIQAGNGDVLLNTQVDQLIQAMASFTQDTGLSWDQGIDQQPAQVQSILAASWQ